MKLTEYEQKVFDQMDTMRFQYNVDYVIKADRPDRLELIEAIKKYIDTWNNYEFNATYTKFRRCERFNKLQFLLPKPTSMEMLKTLITDDLPNQ